MFFGKIQPPSVSKIEGDKIETQININRESKVFFQMNIYLGECL